MSRSTFKVFKSIEYEVHTASDSDFRLESVDKSFKFSIKRIPFSYKSIKAILSC